MSTEANLKALDDAADKITKLEQLKNEADAEAIRDNVIELISMNNQLNNVLLTAMRFNIPLDKFQGIVARLWATNSKLIQDTLDRPGT